MHDGVDEQANSSDADECKEQQAADKESDMATGFGGGLGDAEDVDEGIGKEVEERHEEIMRLWGADVAKGGWRDGKQGASWARFRHLYQESELAGGWPEGYTRSCQVSQGDCFHGDCICNSRGC